MIDAHCHLSFINDDQLMRLMDMSSKSQWVQGGYNLADWKRQAYIKSRYPERVFTCFGLHPWAIDSRTDLQNQLKSLDQFVESADFIGELGLDSQVEEWPAVADLQKKAFNYQIELSKKFNKPIVLHVVKAHLQALEILGPERRRGLVHGFSGSVEVANEYLKLGLKLSLGPNVLKSHYKKLAETIEVLPLESFVFESDRPAKPGEEFHFGQELLEVLSFVAKKKKVNIDVLIEQNQRFIFEMMDHGKLK